MDDVYRTNQKLVTRVKELEAENEQLQALADKAWKQADDANNAALKSALRNAELEAQCQEDADLIEAQKREIEVLHKIRDEAEILRARKIAELWWRRYDQGYVK